jgi:hypothetical protein
MTGFLNKILIKEFQLIKYVAYSNEQIRRQFFGSCQTSDVVIQA